jgi:hypothetical protein
VDLTELKRDLLSILAFGGFHKKHKLCATTERIREPRPERDLMEAINVEHEGETMEETTSSFPKLSEPVFIANVNIASLMDATIFAS